MRLPALLAHVRPYLPDLRDLHVYGGGALLACGVGALWRPAAGLVVMGALLLHLGLRTGAPASTRRPS